MQVTKYLKSNNIKYFPVKLVYSEHFKSDVPYSGFNGKGSHYNEFNTISDNELLERQTKHEDYPLVALNTFEQVILDVDDITKFKEAFPKLEKKLKKKCINYKSRNKRLSHYLIKLINKPDDAKKEL